MLSTQRQICPPHPFSRSPSFTLAGAVNGYAKRNRRI
jgi:hypothetical protein